MLSGGSRPGEAAGAGLTTVRNHFARAMVVSTLEGRTSFTETFRMLCLGKMATFNELGRSLGVGY